MTFWSTGKQRGTGDTVIVSHLILVLPVRANGNPFWPLPSPDHNTVRNYRNKSNYVQKMIVLFNQAIFFFLWHVFYSHLVERVLLIESECNSTITERLWQPFYIFNIFPMNFIQASQWFVCRSTTRKKSRAINGRVSLIHSQTNWLKQKVNTTLLQPRTTSTYWLSDLVNLDTLILRYSPIRSDTGFICESKGVHSYT